MLSYLAARAIRGVEAVSATSYRRAMVTDGVAELVDVSSPGPAELLVSTCARESALPRIMERVGNLFNLDLDLGRANDTLRGDLLLRPEIDRAPGLRPVGAWDPFEVGVRAIIGQQVTVAGAGTIAARLVARHGKAVSCAEPSGITHLFPAAETLADADLAGIGLTGARIGAIHRFAIAVAEGSVRLERGAALDEFVTSVVALPGLGPWTAHYLALRIGHPDAFPATDLGVRRSLESLTGWEVSGRAAGEIAERWRPWRAIATAHLWSRKR